MTEALLLDTAEQAFAATCTFEVLQRAQDDGWAPSVWDTAAEIGLPWIGVPEAAGGAGGTLEDAFEVLRIAGRHAAPIPLAETGLLAGWLLAESDLPLGEGPLTVVPGRPEDDLRFERGRLHGTAHGVPWGRNATRVVAIVGDHVVSVPTGAASRVDELTNVAGEPRDTLSFDGADADAVVAPATVDLDVLQERGALSRIALMAGALTAMAELTASYTAERVQFGKPIGSFQAVQAHVVTVAEEAALVGLAAQVAARTAQRGPARLEIAAAKSVVGNAVRAATRAAHQAHGAIGMTQEYPLHHLSRRLWSWRAEYGDQVWAERLGSTAAAHPNMLYEMIADGSVSMPSL